MANAQFKIENEENIIQENDVKLLEKSVKNKMQSQFVAIVKNAIEKNELNILTDDMQKELFDNIGKYLPDIFEGISKEEYEIIRYMSKHKSLTSRMKSAFDKYKDIFDMSYKYKKYKVENKGELSDIIANSPKGADLNWLDVSGITDMSNLFSSHSNFNGDISEWDTSNVENMESMFSTSRFNGDISKWNTSKVKNMKSLFVNSHFRGDISNWDTSNVEDMSSAFASSSVNVDISKWNTSKVKKMSWMFSNNRVFNQDISNWDVSNVEDMTSMFSDTKAFNQDLSKWNISKVKEMSWMFKNSNFDSDISCWDLSNVEKITDMFSGCSIRNEYKPIPQTFRNILNKFGKLDFDGIFDDFNIDEINLKDINVNNVKLDGFGEKFDKIFDTLKDRGCKSINVKDLESIFNDLKDFDLDGNGNFVYSYKDDNGSTYDIKLNRISINN